MKIDLSTLFLITLCVIPGLFAQRSRNLVCPRSFVDQGASSELGELVALGISTHGLLVLFATVTIFLLGLILHFNYRYFFVLLDHWAVERWADENRSLAVFLATAYIFTSFAVSHWLGLLYGIWRYQAPLTTAVFTKTPKLSAWITKFGIGGVLGEKPIIYEVLSPKIDPDGVSYNVFVELEMKDHAGFYAGQLSEFAIVKDEEPHKPIYLLDVSYRKTLDDTYVALDVDGIMLDLADALQVSVKQIAP